MLRGAAGAFRVGAERITREQVNPSSPNSVVLFITLMDQACVISFSALVDQNAVSRVHWCSLH